MSLRLNLLHLLDIAKNNEKESSKKNEMLIFGVDSMSDLTISVMI